MTKKLLLTWVVMVGSRSLYGMEQSNPKKALIEAAWRGDTEAFRALICSFGQDGDVNAQDNQISTPFFHAAVRGHTVIMHMLAAAGADVNAPDNFGYTALMRVARMGNTATVKELIALGAAVNIKAVDGNTALTLAAGSSNVELFKELIAAGADIHTQTHDGTTVLMEAAQRGSKEMVQVLIALKVDVNVKDKQGTTALMLASGGGYTMVAKELLAAYADINAQDNWGDTALMVAAYKGYKAMVKVLIDAGACVNVKRHDGGTALICAADNRHEGIFELLIAAGADIKDIINLITLEQAIYRGHRILVHELIVAGADITTKGISGHTPLGAAIRTGRGDFIVMLIGAGGVLNTAIEGHAQYSLWGKELFEIAKLKFPDTKDKERDPVGYVSQMEILQTGMSKLRAFAAEYRFVDLVDEGGNTPLYYAVWAGNRPMVVLLLYLMAQAKYAASVTHKNNEGYSPIDIAVVKSPKYMLPVFMKMLECK